MREPGKDNVYGKKREERILSWLVRISAGIVGVLLVVFFAIIIQSMGLIKDQVENVKDGPYPISVAAGHIETDLVRLETVIEHLTATHVFVEEEYEERYEDSFKSISEDIKKQLAAINPAFLSRPQNYEDFNKDFYTLSMRLSVFTVMCWHPDEKTQVEFEEIVKYAENYLYPTIRSLIEYNDDMLQETNEDVEEMYSTVNTAISTMFAFALAMFIATIIMIGIYIGLLYTRTRFENELRSSLEDALKAMSDANEAKSSFLSNMSHDIRTPMNAIVGLTTIADENIDDKIRVKQCLTRISTSSQHLLSLINDVLDMNKIESGKVTLSKEDFSLTELVNELSVIVRSQPIASKRETAKIFENIDYDYIYGDTMRLKQILLNLVSNALKYTNEGDEVTVTVREEKSKKPGWTDVTFIVKDTGIGMKKDFIKHIFEPFERERNDFTIFTEGTGLGMAITKNLVDLMGGTIKVDSELGMGTTVTITIPFEIVPEDKVKERKALKEMAKDRAIAKASVKGRVLVVEDNEINLEIAKTLIESRGAEVETAADGLEALTMFSDSPVGYYSLIFMDWQMPHMNGVEATIAIRKFADEHGRGRIPIVAMTANAFDSDRKIALEAGMDDFMAKPINIHVLDETLQKYLDAADEEEGQASQSDMDAADDVDVIEIDASSSEDSE